MTSRLLLVYAFFIPLESLLETLFSVDTAWKPFRLAAVLVGVAALIEWPHQKFDRYDKSLFTIFLTGCLLSVIWLIVGVPEPDLMIKTWAFVLLPFAMYLCMKLAARTPQDLARMVRAFVMGATVNACYAVYEAISLGKTSRPGGLSGENGPPDLALHCGLAFAFVLFPCADGRQARWWSVAARACCGAALCFAVAVSGTRAAWTGLVVATAVLGGVIFQSKSQRTLVLKAVGAVAAILIAALLFNFNLLLQGGHGKLEKEVENRLAWGKDLRTGAGRTEIWGHAIDAASDYYFLGGGFSGYIQATYKRISGFNLFRPSQLHNGLEHGVGSHNVFLEVLVDYGPLSLLLFFACMSSLIASLYERARRAMCELTAHGMLYALLFLLICGLFRDLTGSPDFWMIMAFVTLFIRFRPSRLESRLQR
jgi:O-antigen ligase